MVISIALLASCGGSSEQPAKHAHANHTNVATADDSTAPETDADYDYDTPVGQGVPFDLKKGINLGDALDAPTEGEWGVVLTEKHFEMAAAAGFDHIRLPVRFNAHADDKAPYTIDDEFFKRVDWAVQQALSHKLKVIIDMHHYEELNQDPKHNKARFVELWKQIAHHYKDQPIATVYFELMNEPCCSLVPSLWNPLLKKTMKAVRAENPTRWVLIDPYFWANTMELKHLELPAKDHYLAATFHEYQPILFTHQGAPWMGPEYKTLGVVYPGPPAKPITPIDYVTSGKCDWCLKWFDAYNTAPAAENPAGPTTIDKEYAFVDKYAAATKIPLYLGEFGVIDKADPASRANYLRAVRQAAESRNIGWCYWDDGGSFKIMDVKTGLWNENLKKALLGP
jgi:endoglucanase